VEIVGKLRQEAAAEKGRPEQAEYLRGLCATEIVPREEFAEVTKKPLESERWSGCVDAVAGAMLGRVLKQMKYGTSVAAIGLAGGAAIEGALITPFILRGVNLLGINSVATPRALRLAVWNRLASGLKPRHLDEIADKTVTLAELPHVFGEYIEGSVRGRTLVDLRD